MNVSEKIAHGTTQASYMASGGTVIAGGMTTNEMIAIGGLILGFLTFLVNWYYRHKTYELAVAARMDDIKKMGEH